MIDTTTPKGRIVAALLRLATERRWDEVTMVDIAEAAEMSLIDLRKEFTRKAEMLSSFGYMVDEEVLRRAPRRPAAQAKRDAIFDVVMSRFDVLQPYRAALKSAADAGALDGSVLRSLMRSQAAMLQAAGVDTEGPGGAVRVAGMTAAFARTFQIWLDDGDPGMARTMATLDRQLRSGERTLEFVDSVCGGLRRMGDAVRSAGRRSDAADKPADPAASQM
jgi:AcrR family transcriptional regulator